MNIPNIPATEILNPKMDDKTIAYWLSQFKKETWHIVLKFAKPEIKTPSFRTNRKELIKSIAPLVRWCFATDAYNLEDSPDALGLVCYHADEDWGKLATVRTFALDGSPNWGAVNVGARLVCFRDEEMIAASKAYAAGLGVSEWRAFMPKVGK